MINPTVGVGTKNPTRAKPPAFGGTFGFPPMLDHGFGLEAYGGARLFGPVGGEETNTVGGIRFEIGYEPNWSSSTNPGMVLRLLEVGVAGKLEGEVGQGEVGIGFEAGGEGNPTVSNKVASMVPSSGTR